MDKQESRDMIDKQEVKKDSLWHDITVRDILNILISKIIFILAAGLIVGSIAYVYARFFRTPMYRSYTTMYVYANPELVEVDGKKAVISSELNAAESLANDYRVAIKTSRVSKEIIRDLKTKGYDVSKAQLNNMTDVSQINGTSLIKIVVTSSDAELACKVANAYFENTEKINEILQMGKLSPIDEAEEAKSPFAPNISKYTIIGILIGVVLMSAFFVIKIISDTTIYSENEIGRLTKLPIIGGVPEISAAANSRSDPWIVEEGGVIQIDDIG